MTYIASLLISAQAILAESPLEHQQGNLIPIGDIIPDWKIEDKDRPQKVYGFKKKEQPLDWRILGGRFTIVLDIADPEKDRVALSEKLNGAIVAIQKKLDIAIEQFPGEVTMLPWLDKGYRQGFGDYDNYNGGYGSITDPRTGNLFCLFIYSQKQDQQQTPFCNTRIEAIFEISLHFALVALTDKKNSGME